MCSMNHCLISVFSVILICISCMSVKVTTDSRDGFFINKYKTYNYDVNHYSQNDTVLQVKRDLNYFKERIDEQLKSFGLNLSENPDLLLNVGVVFENREQVKASDPRYDINYTRADLRDWEREDFIGGYNDVGAITVDFLDINKNELVWQGAGIGIITRNERKMKDRIREAVEKMFLDMPKK